MIKMSSPQDEIRICFCHAISEGRIKEAIRNEGARSVEDIRRLTQANTGCGGCLCEVERILSEAGISDAGQNSADIKDKAS